MYLLEREVIYILHTADLCEQRAHHPRLLRLILGLAADDGLRAAGRLNRGARRARRRWRAGHNGATCDGAGRALTDLAGLVARADAGRARRHGGLQDILGHIRRGRALALQHVAAEVGLGRARRDGRLQNILGPVDGGAASLIVGVLLGAVAVIAAGLADLAGALGYVYEGLLCLCVCKKNNNH